jgi:hypothetical protein
MINNLLPEALNELFSLLADPLVQRTDRMRPYLMHFLGCLNQLSKVSNQKKNGTSNSPLANLFRQQTVD